MTPSNYRFEDEWRICNDLNYSALVLSDKL